MNHEYNLFLGLDVGKSDLAVAAEDSGFDAIWAPDHFVPLDRRVTCSR